MRLTSPTLYLQYKQSLAILICFRTFLKAELSYTIRRTAFTNIYYQYPVDTNTRHIINISLCLGTISIVYFLGMLINLPFGITALLIVIGCVLISRWIYKNRSINKVSTLNTAILLIGVIILTNKAYYLSSEYGYWDAWYIWNYHGKYLSDPQNWKMILSTTDGAHPDYPMVLPSILAFLKNIVGNTGYWISNYAFHYLITLLIPVLIFTETFRNSVIFSSLALILLVTNDTYISQGLAQYADTLLAFFFLCSVICFNNRQRATKSLIYAGAFLGLCLWTKNEGAILAALFILFNTKTLFTSKRYRLFFSGMAIPLGVLLLYKLAYAPQNDMIAAQSTDTYNYIFDLNRYKIIYNSFIENLNSGYREVKYGLLIYLLLLIIKRRLPSIQILMVLTICMTYMLIYVFTYQDLEWHLFTSQSRLMHQLLPVTMYLLAKELGKDDMITDQVKVA